MVPTLEARPWCDYAGDWDQTYYLDAAGDPWAVDDIVCAISVRGKNEDDAEEVARRIFGELVDLMAILGCGWQGAMTQWRTEARGTGWTTRADCSFVREAYAGVNDGVVR